MLEMLRVLIGTLAKLVSSDGVEFRHDTLKVDPRSARRAPGLAARSDPEAGGARPGRNGPALRCGLARAPACRPSRVLRRDGAPRLRPIRADWARRAAPPQ